MDGILTSSYHAKPHILLSIYISIYLCLIPSCIDSGCTRQIRGFASSVHLIELAHSSSAEGGNSSVHPSEDKWEWNYLVCDSTHWWLNIRCAHLILCGSESASPFSHPADRSCFELCQCYAMPRELSESTWERWKPLEPNTSTLRLLQEPVWIGCRRWALFRLYGSVEPSAWPFYSTSIRLDAI